MAYDDFPLLIASELCLTLQVSLMNLTNSSDPFQIGTVWFTVWFFLNCEQA